MKASRIYPDSNETTGADSIDAVAEKIGDQLTDLTGYGIYLRIPSDLRANLNSLVPGARLEERDERAHHWTDPYDRRSFCFAIKAKSLPREMRYAVKFLINCFKVFLHIFANGAALRQIDQIC